MNLQGHNHMRKSSARLQQQKQLSWWTPIGPDVPHILLCLSVLSEVMMNAETDLTGLAPFPEAEGLPVGCRVLVDHHQQLTLSGHVSIHVHLYTRTHYCVEASAGIAALPDAP